MVKKILLLLLILGIALIPATASAQIAWPLTAKTYTADDENDLTNVTVYGISILATSASAMGGIYDTDDLSTAAIANCRGEVGEASQYDVGVNVFPHPVRMSNVTIIVDTGALTVYYR